MKPQETRQPKTLQQLTLFLLLCLGTLLIAVGCQSGQTYPDLTERPECEYAPDEPTLEDFKCYLSQSSYDQFFDRELTQEQINKAAEAFYEQYQRGVAIKAGEFTIEESKPFFKEKDEICEDEINMGCFEFFFTPKGGQEVVEQANEVTEKNSNCIPGFC